MAKSARSNTKKQLHTWRRENLPKQAEWTGKAEQRRLEALQSVLNAPKPLSESTMEEQQGASSSGRGREGAPEGDVEMDGAAGQGGSKSSSKKRAGKKGVKVGGAGVGKKKRAGKAFLQCGNQFHRQGKKSKRSHKTK